MELTGAGKDMRKLMKKLEKNGAYDDSDDEKNPYASSVGVLGMLCPAKLVKSTMVYRKRNRKKRYLSCLRDLQSFLQSLLLLLVPIRKLHLHLNLLHQRPSHPLRTRALVRRHQCLQAMVGILS